jgi:AcrR family transcriptional regulator
MSTAGLRERKKAATKLALSQAALALVLERGLDAVNGDAIAAAAGVAPRTFRNYFSNKEEAVLFVLERVQDDYVETFLRRDPSEPVLDALEAAAIGLIEATDSLEQLIAAARVTAHNPALVAHRAASRGGATAELLREVAARTGTDPHRDLAPRLVVRAADAVVQSVVELYASKQVPRSDLAHLVRAGFDQLRHGLTLTDGGPIHGNATAPS